MSKKPTADAVAVRMYRHGFGDCFLLSFLNGDERVFSMLVDCGIKLNTKSAAVPIEAVVADLKETLTPEGGGRPAIDVLVATHEHWDHVAFFHPDGPVSFADFDIGQVWLAWTEDPDDAEAAAINARLRDGAAALQVAAARLGAAAGEDASRFRGLHFGAGAGDARRGFAAAVQNVLGFYGATSESGIRYKPNGKISVATEEAMTNVVELGTTGGGVTYLRPGTTVDRRSLPAGVNVYVLGPPRSGMINKSDPTQGAGHETYFGIDHTGLAGFVDGLLGLGGAGGGAGAGVPGPFAAGVGLTADAAGTDPYYKRYFAADEAYRRIDNSWLDAVGAFSLQLDGAVNNTSLVLAVELEASGKVLLFPGDAQVGSWLSWHELEWKVRRGDRTETVTAEDLLRTTVLYKVSHHGSHNATVRDRGLELMTHPDLVAMIPEKEKSYNGILYQPLMDRLHELCKGRVIVSADADHPPEALLKRRPAVLPAAGWKAFKEDLTVGPLAVEYTVR
jgi:hypothetical protein